MQIEMVKGREVIVTAIEDARDGDYIIDDSQYGRTLDRLCALAAKTNARKQKRK